MNWETAIYGVKVVAVAVQVCAVVLTAYWAREAKKANAEAQKCWRELTEGTRSEG